MTAARIPYVAARERQLPYALSMIHMQFLTPAPALVLNGLIATIMVIPNDAGSLVDYFRLFFCLKSSRRSPPQLGNFPVFSTFLIIYGLS